MNSIQIDHFLVDIQVYDGKDDKSFTDWITQAEKIAKLSQCLEIQLAWAKSECIVYKLIDDMPQSMK